MSQIIPKPIEDLIDQFQSLPGIGPRTAARLAYFVLRAPDTYSQKFAKTLSELKEKIVVCSICFNYSESEVCGICARADRNEEQILVVEEPLDVMAFEKSAVFKGLYHVLGGVISPVNGIGPDEIRVRELINRVKMGKASEIIIATNPDLEGESTSMYIKKELDNLGKNLKVTRIARGVPTGADLEYADELTLEKALEGRVEL